MGNKKAECCECGKEIEIPDSVDPDEIAVFCSDNCIQAESRRAYQDEMRKQLEEREK